MAANGADYNIIHSYLIEQRKGSWKPECCAMKYFLLQQRQDPLDQNEYFLGPEGVNGLCSKFGGLVKSQDLDRYTKTVAMYKAFTAIALMKTQFSGKNLKSIPPTCILQRGMNRTDLVRKTDPLSGEMTGYEGYNDVKDGETFNGIKGGIAESTALGSPAPTFIRKGYDIHEMTIPLCRIHAVYFISPELCCDDNMKMKSNTLTGFGVGHEFVCDLKGLQVKLIKTDANG
jgi:hypothetical protein